MQSKKSSFVTRVVLGIVLSFWMMSLAGAASGQAQELKTLKLVRTYQSEVELQATYPDGFPQNSIKIEGETITFFDTKAKRALKQLKKEQPKVLREEKREGYTVVTYKSYAYTNPMEAPSFLICTEYEGGYIKETQVDPPELRPTPQKNILYNAKGEVITQLPLEVNSIIQSPDNQYFVAYGEGETTTQYLYFYSSEGTLLNTQEVNVYPVIHYAWNGAFIAVANGGGGQFFIFTKTGEIHYAGNYRDFGLQGPLYAVLVSENGKTFLISVSKDLQLCTISGQCLWKIPSSAIYDAQFLSQKGLIVLKSRVFSQGKDFTITMHIISLSTGTVMDEIDHVSEATVINAVVVIKKEGTYYEYAIQ